MTNLPTPEEMFQFVRSTFEAARSDAEVVQKLGGTEITLKVITSDPESVLIIDTARQDAWEGSIDDEADATLRMSLEAASRFWQGELNLLAAITRGVVRVQGKKSAVVRALPVAIKLFPLYIQTVKDAGRDDLLYANNRSNV